MAEITARLVILYFINTTLVSAIVCLVQSRPLHEVFRTCNFYSFPAYLVGTLLTGMMMESSAAGPAAMFLLTGLLLPAYTFYRSWLTSRARA